MLFLGLIVICFGLIIGSFLNVCIYRIPQSQSLAFPPSHCTKCGTRIRYRDLIPVISYLLLRGRCRECGDRISIRYPIVEAVTGALTLLLFMKFGYSVEFLKYSLLGYWLIVIGLIDLDTTDIYFSTTASGVVIAVAFILYAVVRGQGSLEMILGGIVGGGFIALIVLLTGGMGWGDAEVMLMVGLFLGFPLTLVALLLSFVFGGFAGAILLLLKLKTRKDYIPFAPYISLGAVVAVLLGNYILAFYIG